MTDNFGSMKALADRIGKYVRDKWVKPIIENHISFYKAEVVTPASGGRIVIQRPFDNATQSLPFASWAGNLQAGDACIVAVFGSTVNSYVIGGGAAANWGSNIPFGTITNVSGTDFEATVPGVTQLRDGVCAYIRNDDTNTSASGWTLNVNGLGAKPVYQSMAAASAVTTTFNKNYTMLFIYNTSRVAGGCWDLFYGYYSTTNYNIRDNQAAKNAAAAIYRYMFCLTATDGTLIPTCNTSNSTATTKTLSTTAFNPHAPIYYYGSTTTVASGSAPAAGSLYTQYGTANMRYGFNCSTTGLTAKNPVYIRCAPQTDGTAKLDGNNCLVQALPTTDDGKIYIYLGYAYSGYQVDMSIHRPIYYYKNGAIRVWTGPV